MCAVVNFRDFLLYCLHNSYNVKESGASVSTHFAYKPHAELANLHRRRSLKAQQQVYTGSCQGLQNKVTTSVGQMPCNYSITTWRVLYLGSLLS